MTKTLPLLLTLFIATACIDPVNIKPGEEDPIVAIDATFTNVEEMQTVRVTLSYPLSLQKVEVISGAEVYVENQNGERNIFPEQEDGSYAVEAQAIAGNQYRLLVTLPDGRFLTTSLQGVPSAFPIDDVSIVDTSVMVLNENGNRSRINSIDFYAAGTANEVLEDYYLRFSYETAYQVKEVVCNPLITPKICYFPNDQRPNGVNLLRISQSENPVSYKSYVYRRRINNNLGEAFALNVSLLSYNKTEYDYWENLEVIFNQTGNITDKQPARLVGNITADDGSEILGQFAVVGKTSELEFVVDADFVSIARPLCGLPGFIPNPLPNGCCNCLNLEGATTEKPIYWPQ